MPSHLDTGDPEAQAPDRRYFGIREATVLDNEDPRGLGRVRVTVPGIIEAPGSAWAFPVGGLGGGAAQVGAFDVPPVGASAYVFFLDGDVDKPRYLAGHYGAPGGEAQTPTPAKEAFLADGKAGPPKVKVWESEKFAIAMDDREGSSRMYIYATGRGDPQNLTGPALMVELDAEQGTVAISAPTAISIKTLGTLELDGMIINIGGRKVLPIAKPI